MARVFNAVAAMGICASLAMLGWEVQAERPTETRYSFSVVMPPPSDSDDSDDADAPPSANDRHSDDRSHPGDDDERNGHPITRPDPNAAIPI